jgi:hypothetical protein
MFPNLTPNNQEFICFDIVLEEYILQYCFAYQKNFVVPLGGKK